MQLIIIQSFFITLLILKKLQEVQNNSPKTEVADTSHLLLAVKT